MDAILELARRLGKQIAEDPRAKTFHQAQADLNQNTDAQQLLKSFNEQIQRVQSLEEEHKPIEPEDKRKLAETQQQISGNACLSAYAKAQADYVELMQHVSAAVENPGNGA
ncbi:MAG: YlbF family regulator [bacterium]|nr:YlbF family regulator [bacterium]